MEPMHSGNLYEQSHWDSGYKDLEFAPVNPNDQVAKWLQEWTQTIPGGSCLEIGCFPGRYLALFGKRGFTLNGVDLTPKTDPEMKDWLTKNGYSVGQIVKADFFKWEPKEKFDVVYSNGFLEHFEEWESVLKRHIELVKPGGLLLISAPNFRGSFQKFLHRWVDQKNLDMHYLPSMDPDKWQQLLLKEDFEIRFSGYFYGFDFWVGVQDRNLFQKLAFWGLRTLIPALRLGLPKNSAFSSPYCGIVAQKKCAI